MSGAIVHTAIVIDDDDAVRRATARVASALAHTVLEARNGAEGVALFAAAPDALVFLDLNLPDIPGEIVLDQLRALARDARVVVVTGETMADARRRVGEGVEIVRKPFTRAELVVAVDRTGIAA